MSKNMIENKYKYKFWYQVTRTKVIKEFRIARIANAIEVWCFGLHISISMPYKKAFIYSEGWDSGWRVAKGISNEQ